MSRSDPVLSPEIQVERTDGGFVALGGEPWLAVSGSVFAGLTGRFVTLTYRASLWDAPARPVLRFWQSGGTFIDRIATAPVAGSGSWTGRIPPATMRVSISPTNRAGRFGFEVETCRRRPWPLLLVQGLRNRPRSTRSAVLTKLIGWAPESDVNLAWAIGATPLRRFPAWWRARARPVDLGGLDRPRFDWNEGPPIRLVVRPNGDPAALRETLRSLRAQVFTRWTAHVPGAAPIPGETDPRIAVSASPDGNQFGAGLTGVLRAGDRLFPTALAIVAERARREVEGTIFYGDAIAWTGAGARGRTGAGAPLFTPGWSPRLQKALGYLDDSWLFVRDLGTWPEAARTAFLARGTLPPAIVDTLAPDAVRPLRRFLGETPSGAVVRRSTAPEGAPSPTAASAAIIIPTRDHPALLSRLVTSIRARSRAGTFQILVVDNGSIEPDTLAYLASLTGQPDTRLVPYPGPFNFSAMCNGAAALATGDVLVFLNDDTEILSDGWLDRLCRQALDPVTGAAGAKLTYPDGRIQHVGVLIGMGESAGHFGALAPGDDPGWAGRNLVAHEVSAVTGACLAVAREKFEAVGGFDATDLPIELSDIDLCLKLNARGWQAIVDPSVRIMHEESASRGGATLRRLTVYDRERAVFIERWRHVLRDDPVFHPGLSLYSWRAALG